MRMRRLALISLLFLLLAVQRVRGEEEEEEEEDEEDGNQVEKGLSYLAKFGYIDESGVSLRGLDEDSEVLTDAVKDFQHFAGIEQTGKLDKLTVKLMQLPRCGVRDNIAAGVESRKRRRRRYALESSRWTKPTLSWAITKYPQRQSKITNEQVDQTMETALKMWSDISSLGFERVASDTPKIDIDITFEVKAHNDDDPFDGKGGVLAHAYFPRYGGDMHVDDEESWTLNTKEGTNLLQAVLHELGHSLGLSHSNVADSIMAPFYRGYDPNISLKDDDIQAMAALYGPKDGGPLGGQGAAEPAAPPPSPPASADRPPNEICNPGFTMDAIFLTTDNRTYVFSGRKFWSVNEEGVDPGYPLQISGSWPGLPTNIDAAFTWPSNNATYFFKGDKYWKFVNMEPQPGFPKDMSVGFPGIPPNIDTAFVWGGNGKIYFTKGNSFWKFDPDAKPYVRPGKYPADLTLWGLKGPLTAAFQWYNGRTYFFKEKEYWRFDDLRFSVAEDSANPFPRNTQTWWFGCGSA